MAIISHNFALDGFQYPINAGWLATFGEVPFDVEEEPVFLVDPRYWVSAAPSNWANSANWSLTSGGSGGASIPTPINVAVFDSSGVGNCTMDASAHIYGIHASGYQGTISQNSQEIICSFASFWSGSFEGGGSTIRAVANFALGNTCDFTSTDGTFSCDGTVLYAPSSGSFIHNNGTVSIDGSGAFLSAPNISFSKLQFSGAQVRLDKSCYVEDQLSLKAGSTRKVTDSTVRLRGDLFCDSSYNQWGSLNDFPIAFDSTTKQSIFNDSGSVTPSVLINKSVTDQVVLEGRSPFVIKDEFRIQDGTFNSNGRSIQVGL